MQWFNEPRQWQATSDGLRLTTDAHTDFWRKTHYGFIRDNGHFYFQEAGKNFVAQVKFSGKYHALYDQAGLVLRVDELTWLKCGIEYVNNVQQASVVVTREYSDWSVTALHSNPAAIWLRVVVKLPAVEVYYSLDGETYAMIRMAYLADVETLQVGMMACSPDGDGCEFTFEEFSISNQ